MIFFLSIILLFVYELLMIGYINLTKMEYYTGNDAFGFYLKAVEIWRQKTLFPANWAEQTILIS